MESVSLVGVLLSKIFVGLNLKPILKDFQLKIDHLYYTPTETFSSV